MPQTSVSASGEGHEGAVRPGDLADRARRPAGGILQDHELVGVQVVRLRERQLLVRQEARDVRGRSLELGDPRIQFLDLDLVLLEILGRDPEGVGLDPHIDVLGHEPHVAALLQRQGHGQDLVVDLGRIQARQVAVGRLDHDLENTPVFHDHAGGDGAAAAQAVDEAGDGAGVFAFFVVELLELVQFLQGRDGNDHAVVPERGHGLGIVQQHVGVEEKGLDVLADDGVHGSLEFRKLKSGQPRNKN